MNYLKTRSNLASSLGFTIVELLIVIVVIGILATIVIVAYSGVQAQAQNTREKGDLAQLAKAIITARTISNKTLIQITGNNFTGAACDSKPNGTDFALLPKTDACWVNYYAALDAIGAVDSTNLHNMVDPWGRPYFIDESEGEAGMCVRDGIAVYSQPFVSGARVNYTFLPNTGYTGCTVNTN